MRVSGTDTKIPPRKLSTTMRIVCALVLSVMSVVYVLTPNNAYATGQITNRSLTLLSGTNGPPPDGGSKPSGIVKHKFTFTAPASSAVQSIQIKFCTTAADVGVGTCTGPTGLSDTTATISAQTGTSGWTIFDQTASNVIILTHSGTTNISAGISITLAGMVNPSTANRTFFGRITTYTTADASNTATDAGSVAASTTNVITVTGIMPESLIFCTGEAIGLTASVPDCTTATAGAVSFNALFDPTATATATSQMAASTNAGFGYAITINGTTLTSGANTVTKMATTATSTLNTSQFGLNLMINTTPAVGLALAPASNGTNYQGNPSTTGGDSYGTANNFTFNDGDIVAKSDQGTPGTPIASDSQIYTVSYIANVPGSQPAGTYVATLTYVCTASY